MGIAPPLRLRAQVRIMLPFLAAAATSPGQAGPEARFAEALAMPCSAAVAVFKDLTSDSTAPDSIRREASGRRADIAFAFREYETALDYYKKAVRLEKRPGRFRYRTAVALQANGDTAEAVEMYGSIIDSGESPFRQEASVRMGEILLGRGDCEGAMEMFRKTGPFSFRNGWSIHALLGKLECARRLGLEDSAAEYDRRLSGYRKTILEKERLRRIRGMPPEAAGGGADSSAAAAKEKVAAAADTVFSVQVGAFASKANAEALVRKLKRKFKDVSCVSGIVEERTFYRVWVGSFGTREAAELFGRDLLMKEGYMYRIVTK